MQEHTYEIESIIERDHWWYVVRRELCKKYLDKYSKNAAIIDIGSGAGTNLRLLKEMGFTNYHGLDFSPLSKKICAEKKIGEVVVRDIYDSNLPSDSYDVVLITDVLEHLNDDLEALKEIRRILKPNGVAIITIPCFMSLWGIKGASKNPPIPAPL